MAGEKRRIKIKQNTETDICCLSERPSVSLHHSVCDVTLPFAFPHGGNVVSLENWKCTNIGNNLTRIKLECLQKALGTGWASICVLLFWRQADQGANAHPYLKVWLLQITGTKHILLLSILPSSLQHPQQNTVV